jgi:4-hydroxy-tetrahydrodipicolinate synthase
MTMLTLGGLIPPIPTPTAANGELNLPVLGQLVDRILKSGAKGIIALGGVGEYGALSARDRSRVVEHTVKATAGRGPVVAGVVQPGFHEAIESINESKAAGADAFLVIPPVLQKPTQAGVRDYYKALHDRTGAAIMVYDEPDTTHFVIEPQTHANMAADGSIVAIKASNKSIDHFNRTYQLVENRVPLLAGSTPVFPLFVAMGAVGGTIGNACFMPDVFVRIFDLVRAGKLDEALVIHRALTPFMDSLSGNYLASFKQAFKLFGLDCGDPLLPGLPLDKSRFAVIENEYHKLKATGILGDK